MTENEETTPKSQEQADEIREEAGTPGKVAGEDAAPAEANLGETSESVPGDADATGDGPTGGAPTGGGIEGDSTATGAGGSGGAPADSGGGTSSGDAAGAGGSGGAAGDVGPGV
jgi:hypothetical protein